MKTILRSLFYPVGTYLKITKISKSNSPVMEPCAWDDWNHGGINNASLPVDYEMHGILLASIKHGGQIHLLRTWRNGVEAVGYFYSTPICAIISESRVETFNSIYEIVPL